MKISTNVRSGLNQSGHDSGMTQAIAIDGLGGGGISSIGGGGSMTRMSGVN
jgi:hypothetical protein